MAGRDLNDAVETGGRPRSTAHRHVSIIVPVFNEEAAIRPFVTRLRAVFATLPQDIACTFLFVDDGSTDGTGPAILSLCEASNDIGLVSLSKNFGKEAALTAGLAHSDGDAAIPMDVDLQDPPDLIPRMIDLWRQGAKVVNARRENRTADTWGKRLSARAFYRLFNTLAEEPIPDNVGDFRLLDREVVDAVLSLKERNRFNKALFHWVGFHPVEIAYDRPARSNGRSRWSFLKLQKLALDGIFSSSTLPLRLWTYLGVSLSALAVVYAAFIFLRTLIIGVDVPGYASTAILILFFGGMNMLALGIIGEYVGRIYREVQQRPLYIVRATRQRGDQLADVDG